MTAPDEMEPDVHPVAMLLPWYLNGTLREEELQQVVQHLAGCHVCRSELEELTRLRQQVVATYAELPGPSPQAFRSVMATIEQEHVLKAEPQGVFRWERAKISSWMDALDRRLRPIFAPRWVPVLASTLIVGQLAVLLWVVGREPARSPQERPVPLDGVVSRGIPMAAAHYRIAFHETAPEREIRAVIHTIGGRIVDGPSPDGFYTVAVPTDDPTTLEKKLTVLRNQPNLVRVVEQLNP